ncbi:MAG: metallophosphoesterase [Filomicrobium sp.]
MTANSAITLAHLSDLHMPRPGFASPRHWTIKRSLGYINWQRGRKRAFAREATDAIVADLLKKAPDHIAVTGDLTNFGLPDELDDATKWLTALGPSSKVSVVPGNHDIYVPLRSDIGTARWAEYMRSDQYGASLTAAMNPLPPPGGDIRDAFPYVRRMGNVALIGLNSSLPMPPFVAAGVLGQQQLDRLEDLLKQLAKNQLFRLIIVHHPPLKSLAGYRRGLRDANQFADVLRRAGAELVLHGHNHTNTSVTTEGPNGPVPVIGIAAAGMVKNHKQPGALARYNLITINDAGTPNCQVHLTGYGLLSPNGPVVELENRDVPVGRADLGVMAGA